MRVKNLLLKGAVLLVIISCFSVSSLALTIDPNYGNFTGTELLVLKDAVKEWGDLFRSQDGKTISISFFCDTDLQSKKGVTG